jgi:DNA-binding CsgD family transcriptional regulator
MVQRRRDPGLSDEPFAEVLVVGEMGREHLEGDVPPQANVLGEIDDARAPPADDRLDPVARELRPDPWVHRPRVWRIRDPGGSPVDRVGYPTPRCGPEAGSIHVMIGREQERVSLNSFLDDAASGPAVLLLEGEQGIGKSALWNEGVDEARRRGLRVLDCRPSGPDAELAFAALGDLLGAATEASFEALADPQREALEIALLRRPKASHTPDPRAVAVAVLEVLRTIAADGPAVVAIDDVQWIDPATARVMTFATRRLSDERVGLLLARPATEEPPPLGVVDALPVDRVRIVGVGPLDAHQLSVIVRERTGWSPTKPESERLAEASGGNPFYALEIARARARGDEGVTGQRLPIPRNLREDLLLGRVGDVSSDTRDVLILAASMARPSVDLLGRVTRARSIEPSLQGAIDAGVIEVLAGDVRFTHPLYRSAVYADASRIRRHEAHRRLAEVVIDPDERARHLALSVEGTDPDVAAAVERAAASAIDRGAPDVAADLLEHAVRMTPPEDVDALQGRSLLAAQARSSAGDTDGARAHAEEALRISAPGRGRAAILHQIGRIDLARGALVQARATFDEALAQTRDDPRMAADIHREQARTAIRAGEVGAAERNVAAGLGLTQGSDDDLTLALLTTGAEVDVLLARPPDLTRVLDAPDRTHTVSESPELVAALSETMSGDLRRAEERLRGLLAVAVDRGDEPGRLLVTDRLIDLKIRKGAWSEAEELVDVARRLAIDLRVSDRLELGLSAYAAAGLGRVEDARRLAEQVLDDPGGDRPAQLWCLAALGFLELSLSRFPEALRHLERAGGLLAETGIADPGAFPFLADEAEALIAAGEIDTASLRLDVLDHEAERLDRNVLRGQVARCRGLALAAGNDLAGSLEALDHSVAILETAELPMEAGRSLLALGVSMRRARQKRSTREILERGVEAFERSGAPLWADRARDEIARIGGRRASVGELTEAEERVARLAASGLANREIAQTLFLGVRTVEGTLSRVYAKLEVRTRTELALFFDRSE